MEQSMFPPFSDVYAVIPAAGSGSRMAAERNKQLLAIAGQPIIVRTLSTFAAHPKIKGIVVVAPETEHDAFRLLIEEYGIPKVLAIVSGGADRQASVYEGLKALEQTIDRPDTAAVLIHDGARCLCSKPIIDRTIDGLSAAQAVTAAIPLVDTIAEIEAEKQPTDEADSGTNIAHIESVPDRAKYWRIQTPQGFRLRDIIVWHAASEGASGRYTDDSAIAIAANTKVGLVLGSEQNIKITTAFDLKLAEVFLSEESEK